MLLDSLLSTINHSIIFSRICFFVWLRLSFCILSWVCYAYFDTTSDTTGEDILPNIFRLKYFVYWDPSFIWSIRYADKWETMNIQSKDMVFSMSFSQLGSISSRKVTQLTHCTSSIEAPAASDIDFDFNQTNL